MKCYESMNLSGTNIGRDGRRSKDIGSFRRGGRIIRLHLETRAKSPQPLPGDTEESMSM